MLLEWTTLGWNVIGVIHLEFLLPWRQGQPARPAGHGTLPLIGSSQPALYSQRMLTISSRLDVMNRLGRAMADPTRSRILLNLLEQPGYPAQLARDLDLTRSNVSNHLSCLRGCGIVVAVPQGRQTRYELVEARLADALRSLVDVVLAVDSGDDCEDEDHLVVPR